MKNYSFNLILGILIVLSILFGTFIWEKITIPFNDNMIVGEYSDKKFNPTNDILRYLAFIFLPIIIFFSQVFFRKQNFKNIIFNLNNYSKIQPKKNNSLLPVTEIVDQYYGEVQKLGGSRWDTSSLIKRLRK